MSDKTQDLIREMQENVAKYGRENTTTYLMVQAINALTKNAADLAQARAELEAVGAGGVQRLNDCDTTRYCNSVQRCTARDEDRANGIKEGA